MIRQTTLSRVSLPRVAEYDRATAELSRAIRGLRRLGTAMVVLLLALPLVLGVTDAEAAPLLYLTGGTEVVVLDTATDSVVATIPTSPSQGTRGVAVSADAQRLYLTVVDTAQVLEIDTATNQVVDSSVLPNRGGAVAVHPAGSPVYVDVGTNPSEVAVVDFPSDDVTHIALPFASNPADVAVDPRGTFAYATNFQGGSVSVIDTANKSIVTNVPVGSAPTGVSVNRAGTRAYVANPGSGTVSVIDTATNVVVATVPISPPIGGPGAPTSVVVHPLSTFVYAVNTCAVSDCAGSVSVIDAASNTVVHTVPVGFAPRGIAITPDGTRVYVANGCQFDALPCSSGSISVISTATNQVVNTIPVTDTPDRGENA